VRIPVALLPRLDRAAKRLGTNRARLIAFCVTSFLADFEERGTALMPPDWEQLMTRLDHRTRESREISLVEDRPHRSSNYSEVAASKPDVMHEAPIHGLDKKTSDAARRLAGAAAKIAKIKPKEEK
jgi:hypothetical protein